MREYMSRTLQSYDGSFEFRISEAMALQKFTGCAVYTLDVADVLLNGAVKFFQDKNVKKGKQITKSRMEIKILKYVKVLINVGKFLEAEYMTGM